MYKSKLNSPLGILTLTSDGEQLTGLFIENKKYFVKERFDGNMGSRHLSK